MCANEGSLACVDKRMPRQFVFARVRLATHHTHIWALPRVDAGMHHKPLISQKALSTRAAVVREVVGVDAHVDLEFVPSGEDFAAQVTHLLWVPALTWQHKEDLCNTPQSNYQA